jgi:exodeoxyribonuclease VII small subunit
MPAKKKSTDQVVAESFEDAVEELENITRRLETDPSSLNSLLDDFERGQILLKYCQETLQSARKRLDLIEAKVQEEPENQKAETKSSRKADADNSDDDVRLF